MAKLTGARLPLESLLAVRSTFPVWTSCLEELVSLESCGAGVADGASHTHHFVKHLLQHVESII